MIMYIYILCIVIYIYICMCFFRIRKDGLSYPSNVSFYPSNVWFNPVLAGRLPCLASFLWPGQGRPSFGRAGVVPWPRYARYAEALVFWFTNVH